MNATCPTCGVAVVSGYVRCPKCQGPLPSARRAITTGGTALASSGGGLPILPIAIAGVVVLGLVLYFTISKGDPPKQAVDDTPAGSDEEISDEVQQPTVNPVPVLDEPDPNRVDPNATAKDLERALRRQRLWASVEVVGKDVEVRSGSCRDEQMIPMVDAAKNALRAAGLTRVRCVEQSGAVVFEREL